MTAAEKVQQIAMAEFADKGFDGVSLNEILRKSQISKGSFYYHFKNKEDLYMSLVGKVIEEKWNQIHRLGLDEPAAGGFFLQLRNQFRAAIDFVKQKPDYQRFSEAVLGEKNQELRNRVFSKFRLDNADRLLHLVNIGVECGEIRGDIPPERINRIIMFILQNMSEITRKTVITDYEEEAEWLIDFLENGLKRK